MTDTERLKQIRTWLVVLLAPAPLGEGPFRIEDWASTWSQEQREAFRALKDESQDGAAIAE